MGVLRLNKILNLILAIAFLLSVFFPGPAIAQTVEGNNSDSQNSIGETTSSSTSIEQSNTGTSQNSVNVNLSTGGNNINSSSGNSNINTGDTTFVAEVENQMNSSVVNSGCCNESQGSNISNNNTDTDNLIESNSSETTDIRVSQNANVTNSFNVSLGTGNNKITNSNGGSSISTGDIKAKVSVSNAPINTAYVSAGYPAADSSSQIFSNNTGSTNLIKSMKSYQSKIKIDNNANITNSLNLTFQTGENEITNNHGIARIFTGDVFLLVNIKNSPINSSVVNIDCCSCPGPSSPTPTPTVTTTPTPTATSVPGRGGSSSNSSSSSNSNSTPAQRVEAMVLGATGSFMENMFYVMFAFGCIAIGFGVRSKSEWVPAFSLNKVKSRLYYISNLLNSSFEITLLI